MGDPPQPGSNGAPGGWNSYPGGSPGDWGQPNWGQPNWGQPNWGNAGQYPQGQYPSGPQQAGPYPSGPYPTGPYPTGLYPTGQQPDSGAQLPGQAGAISGPYQVGEGQDFWRQVAAGGPHAPPPRKKRTKWWLLAAGGAGVVLIAAVVITVLATRPETIEAGDCVTLAGEYGGEVSSAECGSDESDYEVVRALEGERPSGCPGTFYNIIGGKTYCVTLDVKVGDCLATYRQEENFMPVSRNCSEPNVDKVTKVANSNNADEVCAEQEGRYWFGEPTRTVCFQQNWR